MYPSVRLGSTSLRLTRLRAEVEDQDDLKHIHEVVNIDATVYGEEREHSRKHQRNDRFNIDQLRKLVNNYNSSVLTSKPIAMPCPDQLQGPS